MENFILFDLEKPAVLTYSGRLVTCLKQKLLLYSAGKYFYQENVYEK